MNGVAAATEEAQRSAALMCLRILDTPPEERFNRITRLVAAHFDVAIAAINFIDSERQWTKAAAGMDCGSLPRSDTFCAHTILQNDILIVPDSKRDARFAALPMVVDALSVRFYAGVAVRTAEGHAVGTLCIADYAPRSVADSEMTMLRDFAAWVERELSVDQLSVALLARQEHEDALRLSEARYEAVIAALSEGIVCQDSEGQIVTCNASAERILGLSAAQLTGRTSIDPRWHAIHPDGTPFPGETHPSMITLRTGQSFEGVVMGIHKPDGSLTWMAVNTHPIRHAGSSLPSGVVASFVDITQQKLYEQQLTAYQRQLETHNAALTVLATTDSLTGLLNKRVLLEQLALELRQAQQNGTALALIMLDVDHFKSYNDGFGHLAGDVMLQRVAELLHGNARSSDLVARYGGEEFALVLPRTDYEGAQRLAERLRQAIAQTSFQHRAITASFGVAVAGTSTSADALIARADAALYVAKRHGRNSVVCAATEHALQSQG